ncbi:MAG TPA: hypothetical protein VIS99_08515 [Terrimicrobiaceae bacterium]
MSSPERLPRRGRAAPITSIRLSPGMLVRRPVAKPAVRTFIVFDTPAFQHNARFVQIAEEFAV